MISKELTRKEFAEKCFAEILSDGDQHTYAEICEYTIQQAQGTKFQNIIDKQGLSGTLRNFIAKDSHYQKVRYGVYQWNDSPDEHLCAVGVERGSEDMAAYGGTVGFTRYRDSLFGRRRVFRR